MLHLFFRTHTSSVDLSSPGGRVLHDNTLNLFVVGRGILNLRITRETHLKFFRWEGGTAELLTEAHELLN